MIFKLCLKLLYKTKKTSQVQFMEVYSHNRTFCTMHNKNFIRRSFSFLNLFNCLTILHAHFFCAKVSSCNILSACAILYARAILTPTHVNVIYLFLFLILFYFILKLSIILIHFKFTSLHGYSLIRNIFIKIKFCFYFFFKLI